MVTALVSGSAKLAEESEYSLTQLREMVSSPAGTTIMATNVLDQHAVRAAIVEAVQASAERSQELGKK
jgi:pyrroline-5-carboxylate reductase